MKVLYILSICSLFSCNHIFVDEMGNGHIMSKQRKLDTFNKIDSRGNFDIELIQGDREGVELTTDENLLPLIDTEVSGNTLIIYAKQKIRSNSGIKCTVYYKDLNSILSGGASSIMNESVHHGKDLKIEMSGAGHIQMNMQLESLKLEINGVGGADLKGNSEYANVLMSGAGGLNAKNLEISTCKIRISGMGGAEILVKNEIDAKVSGIGGITYFGQPEKVYKNVSGIGSISSGD